MVIRKILKSGWTVEEALTTPVKKDSKCFVVWNNKKLGVLEASKLFGINKSTLWNRLKAGLTIEQILTIPVKRGKNKNWKQLLQN